MNKGWGWAVPVALLLLGVLSWAALDFTGKDTLPDKGPTPTTDISDNVLSRLPRPVPRHLVHPARRRHRRHRPGPQGLIDGLARSEDFAHSPGPGKAGLRCHARCGGGRSVRIELMLVANFLLLGAVLFCIGVFGVLARRNAVMVLMSVELILNAVNLNLIAFALMHGNVDGQVFALYVIGVAAAEVGVGLGLVLLVYRNRRSISLDELGDEGLSVSERSEDRDVLTLQLPGWFLEHAWLIPVIPGLAFWVIILFGKKLPMKGSEVGLLLDGRLDSCSPPAPPGNGCSGSTPHPAAAARPGRSGWSAASGAAWRPANRAARATSRRSSSRGRGGRTAASSWASASTSTGCR